jgi:hypothetical protein
LLKSAAACRWDDMSKWGNICRAWSNRSANMTRTVRHWWRSYSACE